MTSLQWLKFTTKSLIQHCERSELRLHLRWTEVNRRKLLKNAKVEKSNETFVGIFKQVTK